MPEENK